MRENGQQVCKCDSNLFKGDFCEIKIVHACDSCLNGGSCFGNGECVCPPGYAGAYCQEKRSVSECGLFSCENKGTCFIDNQNEYSCICPVGFTGKTCQVEITTTSKSTTTQSTTTQTTSTISSTTTTENKVIVEKSESFTSQEIALILIVGVDIQILFILVAVIFYKIVILSKKTDQVADEESGDKVPKQQQQQQHQSKPSKKENIYVICSADKPSQDLTKNINDTISKVATKKMNSNDTEIYSSCIYDDLNECIKNKKIEFVQEKSLF